MLTNELIKKYQFFLNYNYSSIKEMEDLLKSSRRAILSDIQRINEALDLLSLPTIQTEKGVIQVPDISIKELLCYVDMGSGKYIFQEERLDMLVLYLLLHPGYVSNYHLQDLLRMSKNSVLTDLKDIRYSLQKDSISVQYTRSEGYSLKGDGNQLRRLLECTVERLMSLASGKFILTYVLKECGIMIQDSEIFACLRTLSEKYKLTFIFQNTKILAIVIAILNELTMDGTYEINSAHYCNISETTLLKLVQDFEEKYPKLIKERNFILSRLAGCVQGDLNLNPDPIVVQIMDEIIIQVKANTGVEFPVGIPFRKNLYAHLYPAYYRLLFDIPLYNALTSQIKKEYNSLYELVKRSLRPLEEITGKELSSDEIAYFTMHFGGYLQSKEKKKEIKKLKAMIVCPNGVSTSLILQSELKKIFPMMEFKVESSNDFKVEECVNQEEFQVIFTTTHLKNHEKIFVVKPLMSSFEKILLKRRVFEYLHLGKEDVVSLDELLRIIAKHATIKNGEALKKELVHYLFAQESEQLLGGYSLTDLLKKEFIQQIDRVNDWKEAVVVAAQPLLQQNYIEESYIDAIIASISEIGPYIVLAPKVAVPHASPGSGVHKLGVSLLQIKEPVNFSENKDEDKNVQLVFVFSAVDSTSHLTALQQLALILEDGDTIEKIIHARDAEEILSIIDTVIKEGE